MTETAIGWTDQVWNPVTGCSKVSEGCRNCYAETISLRYGRSQHPWSAQFAAENVVLHPDRLGAPLKWKKPARCFVNSMSDLFHEQVPDEYIDQIWDVMLATPQHTYQILTKRPERMHAYARRGLHRHGSKPVPNIWLGTSVEDQRAADERIELLCATPAYVRFLSCEPLLGPLNLDKYLWASCHDITDSSGVTTIPTGDDGLRRGRLSWVIVGGESGPKHRPMSVFWLNDIVSQCRAADVAVFTKQDSGMYPGRQGRISDEFWLHEFPAAPSPSAPRAAGGVGS